MSTFCKTNRTLKRPCKDAICVRLGICPLHHRKGGGGVITESVMFLLRSTITVRQGSKFLDRRSTAGVDGQEGNGINAEEESMAEVEVVDSGCGACAGA